MRQEREFRRGFQFHFVLLAIIVASFIVVGIVAWSPWDSGDSAERVAPPAQTPAPTAQP